MRDQSFEVMSMSLDYIRKTYGVPAKRGARIRFTPSKHETTEGVIVGARDQYLRVRFDNSPTRIATLHPTWEVTYL